jgi:phenylacetic acid degradation operon negative regulatory protein
VATPAPLRDPGPTLSRRHAAGAVSARGLLFTVLGEFVLPTGGSAWTSAFIETFSRLGVEEKAIRQALARTAADGWIRPERHGRRTRWWLAPDGDRLLTEGTERIYAFAGSQRTWDGSWLLVLARVPENDRPARHVLRTRLSWAGLGSPAPGVWITTHTERRDEVEQVLRQAGVTGGQIFTAEHRGGGELSALVGEAWDLSAIEERYEEFLADFASASARDPLIRLTELVHAWRRFPSIDPGLPAQLLPAGWSGARAAKLFASRHAKWSADAVMQWIRLNQAAGHS